MEENEIKSAKGVDIEITTDGVIGSLIVDGVDLSDKASAVTFKFEGGKFPLVTVDFLNINTVHIKSSMTHLGSGDHRPDDDDSDNFYFPQDYNERYGDLEKPEE